MDGRDFPSLAALFGSRETRTAARFSVPHTRYSEMQYSNFLKFVNKKKEEHHGG